MFMFIPAGGTTGSVDMPINGVGMEASLAGMLLKDGPIPIMGLERS